MGEREQFEEWAVEAHFDTDRWPVYDYFSYGARVAWQSWQAARAWRPISEAPRDGSKVWGAFLTVLNGWHYRAIRWDSYHRMAGFAWLDDDNNKIPATHFQPLPEPPEES